MALIRAILRWTGVVTGAVGILPSVAWAVWVAWVFVDMVVFEGDSPWNFPGDPAFFEMVMWGTSKALPLTMVPAILIAFGKGTKQPEESRWVFRQMLVVTCIHLFCLTVAWASIWERCGPRWEAVRNALRARTARVEAETPASARALHPIGLASTQRFLTSEMPDEQVNLPGYGMVTLKPFGMYPWVRVEFDGGYAVFEDLDTMECGISN